MEFNQILELIDHVSASELTAFTYETADLTLSMEHGKPQVIQGVMGETVENIPAAGMAGGKDATETQAVNTASAQSTEQSKPAPQKSDDQAGSLVTSPLVGTFYAAPSQDLPPYVQIGDKVKRGQVLAIVEAMKLMNEIESDFDGEIADALEYADDLEHRARSQRLGLAADKGLQFPMCDGAYLPCRVFRLHMRLPSNFVGADGVRLEDRTA